MVNQIDTDSEMRDGAERLFTDKNPRFGQGMKRQLPEDAEMIDNAKRTRLGTTVQERVSQYEAMNSSEGQASRSSDGEPSVQRNTQSVFASSDRSEDDYGLDDDDVEEAFRELEERMSKPAITSLKRKRDDENSRDDERFTSRRETGKRVGDEILIPDHITEHPAGRIDYLTEKQFSERHQRPVSTEEKNHPDVLIKTKDGGLVLKEQYAWTAKKFPEKGSNDLAKDFERLGLNDAIPKRQRITDNRAVMIKQSGVYSAIDPKGEAMTTLTAAEQQFGKGNVMLRMKGGAYQLREIVDRRLGNGASEKLFAAAAGQTRAVPADMRSQPGQTVNQSNATREPQVQTNSAQSVPYDPRVRESRGR